MPDNLKVDIFAEPLIFPIKQEPLIPVPIVQDKDYQFEDLIDYQFENGTDYFFD